MTETSVSLQPETTNASADPDEVEEKPGALSLRNSLGVLLSSGSGRAGVVMMIGMLLISIYVLATYPRDFGRVRWSSPVVWSDNPKTVPPSWTAVFSDSAIPHRVFNLTEPTAVEERGPAEIRSYDATFDYRKSSPPQFLSTTITGVTFVERAPIIIISLLRPDGGEIRLANVAVPGPRAGEESPYERYFDISERILLTQQDTAASSIEQWYAQEYPDREMPGNFSNNLSAAFFGVPAEDGSGQIDPLNGEFTVRTQFLVANIDDSVEEIEVISGGNRFGWMGTDSLGRDLFEGLLYGFPVALLIASLAATLSTMIGASLGILSGYTGGRTDTLIQRLADIVSNVPVLPLLIFMVFIVGPNLYLIILVLVAFSWPGLTILVRSMVLQLRSGQLVESAQALGASKYRIMTKHVFPQVAPFIVAQMIFFAPAAILAEASLSFLGLGDPSIPTWGQMLEAGFRTGALYVGYWWWVIPPGLLIIVTALAFMLLALGMEQVVDPRLRDIK